MGRRNRAEAAESAASEAGRILQAQKQAQEPAPEAATEPQARSDAPRPPARNEPRRRALEEIENRDIQSKGLEEPKKEEKQNAPVVQDPPPPSAEDMLKGGKFSQPEPAETKAAPQAEEAAPVPEAPKTVKAKVDGEEFDVPEAEIEAAGGVTAWQKSKAAENRLNKANEALAEAKKNQALMLELLAKQAGPQTPAAPPKTEADLLKEKIDVIRWGTPEESAAALREVLAATNKPVDPNQLINQAVLAMTRKSAVDRFKTEFSDVMANPLVAKLAIALEQERLTQVQGQIPDWDNFYRSIGNEIRSVIRPSQTATASPAGNTSQPKEEKKASIVNLPTASARAEPPKEEKPETREDILNKMKKARGIPVG